MLTYTSDDLAIISKTLQPHLPIMKQFVTDEHSSRGKKRGQCAFLGFHKHPEPSISLSPLPCRDIPLATPLNDLCKSNANKYTPKFNIKAPKRC